MNMHTLTADWSAIGNAVAILQGTSELPSNEQLMAIHEWLSKTYHQLDSMPGMEGYGLLEAQADLSIECLKDCGPVEAEELSDWALQDALEAREQA